MFCKMTDRKTRRQTDSKKPINQAEKQTSKQTGTMSIGLFCFILVQQISIQLWPDKSVLELLSTEKRTNSVSGKDS